MLSISSRVVLTFVLVSSLTAADDSKSSVATLLQLVNGTDADARLSATRELFRRGLNVLAEMRAQGAKPMATIAPPRADVIYSLISGDLNGAELDFLGLHFDRPVTREEVREMGVRRGFELPPDFDLNGDASPVCYVRRLPDRNLASVLRDVLVSEPTVVTINLNYAVQHASKK
jgi:hypothetical protein